MSAVSGQAAIPQEPLSARPSERVHHVLLFACVCLTMVCAATCFASTRTDSAGLLELIVLCHLRLIAVDVSCLQTAQTLVSVAMKTPKHPKVHFSLLFIVFHGDLQALDEMSLQLASVIVCRMLVVCLLCSSCSLQIEDVNLRTFAAVMYRSMSQMQRALDKTTQVSVCLLWPSVLLLVFMAGDMQINEELKKELFVANKKLAEKVECVQANQETTIKIVSWWIVVVAVCCSAFLTLFAHTTAWYCPHNANGANRHGQHRMTSLSVVCAGGLHVVVTCAAIGRPETSGAARRPSHRKTRRSEARGVLSLSVLLGLVVSHAVLTLAASPLARRGRSAQGRDSEGLSRSLFFVSVRFLLRFTHSSVLIAGDQRG